MKNVETIYFLHWTVLLKHFDWKRKLKFLGYVHTVDAQTCYMARFGNMAGVARF